MTRAEWLALAERVEREEAGYTINNDVGRALLGLGPDDYPDRYIEYSESLDAAASAMPSGWVVDCVWSVPRAYRCALYRVGTVNEQAEGQAETEPRARLAAALRARAEMVG